MMNNLMTIKKMFPIRDRAYTDRQGQPQVFTSQGFLLTDGLNTVYAETTGQYAKAVLGAGLAEGMTVNVVLQTSARDYTYTDKDSGEQLTRYENQVRISDIAAFG